MENYYKSIAMSEDDNSFAKIYQNYMKDITPLGFYINNVWVYNTCKFGSSIGWFKYYEELVKQVRSFKSKEIVKKLSIDEHMKENIKNKYIIFMGDSTLRQFLHVVYKMFKLKIIGWQDAKQYTNIRVNDIYGLNFTFTFQAHGIPIAGRILVGHYIDIEEQLDDILKKYENKQPTPSAIVMNYDHHVASFAYSFYKIRLISITAKIVEVLKKIPNTKIMLKGAGKQEKSGVLTPYPKSYNPYIRQTLRLSTEMIQFMNSRFLHYMWK
ncbi:hypothetical protein SNEBB_009567 [Seison nebaliae]|nr:hypothetical protein SNEBB_009567 [Seison nebaliae]